MRKKQIFPLLVLIISVGIAISFNSCKRDKDCNDPTNSDCSNYDPCFGVQPIETEIELSQRVALGGKFMNDYFDTASTFPQAQIRFHCPLDGAKYTWTLGTETITSQTFERNFFTVPFGEYTVKLVVEKEPNKQCYPNDNGIDTIIKKFRIVELCELECFGIFKGKWDNSPDDSAIISIRSFENSNYIDSCKFGVLRFTNLQNKQDTLNSDGYISNYELMDYDPGALGLGTYNTKLNPNNNSFVFNYLIGSKQFSFRGRKIAD